MKICQVINSLSSGGAEVFTSQLCVSLKKKGHDVSIVTYQGIIDKKGSILNNYLLENGVKVYHLKGFRKGKLGYIRAFFYLMFTILRINPQIIHAHLQLSDFFAVFIKKILFFRRITLIRTVHNKRRAARLNYTFERFLFKGTDFNIACSDFVKNNYENPSLKYLLSSIPNGIDLSDCKAHAGLDKVALRNELGLPLDKVIFFNIGSMYLSDKSVSKKNQEFIIEALKKIEAPKDIYCLFLGDGTLRKQLEQKVAEYGLSEQVLFTGNVLNVYKYIIASDFCVMPSIDEGLPIALIETVCSGKYALTSSIDAFIPFESDSVYRLKTFDLDEFVGVLNNTISNISELDALAKNNIEYFRDIFDIDIVAEKYLDVYKS